MTAAGVMTTLHSFCSQTGCSDGSTPFAALVQASNGDFYGTTGGSGAKNAGTVFKITSNGVLTTLYSFCSQSKCADGGNSQATLVQAAGGELYGTTSGGGTYGKGTVFKITQSGTLATLYSFCEAVYGCGEPPIAGITQDTNGNFYGTTNGGGSNNEGTVFSVSTGQAPFIKTLPAVAQVGDAVTILGNSLTDATAVAFNGTPAGFTVISAHAISTTVPAGATTGKVQVITSGGPITSNVAFVVAP